MSFAAPWAGVLALALTVPVLVALYLLKLRRRALRVGSTLLWERAVQDLQVNVPLRWLRVSLPLVLQALALAALCAAVARPVFNPLGSGGGRVALLIDRSGVMNARDGGPGTPTRLDEAKRRALDTLEALRRASPPPEVMVVQFAHSAQVLAAFTTDLPTLREAIEGIRPTDQPANLPAALKLLEPFAGPATGEEGGASGPAPRPEALVFSAHPLNAGVGGSAGGARLVRIGPAVGEGVGNLGIVGLSARRDSDDAGTLRLLARVASAWPGARDTTLRVTLIGEGEGASEPLLLPVRVPGATADGPGEATVTGLVAGERAGALLCELPGGDALAADDAAALVISAPLRPRVLLVGPGGGGPAAGTDPFLRSALEAAEPGVLEVVDVPGYEARAAAPGWADGVDLVVLDRARVAAAAPPGAGVLAVGCVPPLAGVAAGEGWRLRAVEGAGPTRCLVWDRAHPVLRHAPLDTLYVSPPMLLEGPDRPAGVPVRTLAEGSAGPLLVAVDGRGWAGSTHVPGRVVVVCFDLARSNWGPDATFPVFMAAAVDWLSGRGDALAGRAATTTEAVAVVPAPGTGEPRLERLGGEGADAGALPVPSVQAAPVPGVSAAASRRMLGPVERAGLYRVVGGTIEGARPGAGGSLVAVNMFDVRATGLGAGATGDASPARGSASGARGGTGSPTEGWPYLVAAALVLSSLEWLVFALRMRG